ncbi:MAG: hypothetical protein AAF086_04550 [Planctomycetota bacterium]
MQTIPAFTKSRHLGGQGQRSAFFLIAAVVSPLLMLVGMLVAAAGLDPVTWERVVHSEQGVLEWLTVLLLLPTVWLAGRTAVIARAWPTATRIWFAVFALGCIYFAGEEASWGQHALGFTPPASIAEGNLQGEFNFHNTKGWLHDILNEIPRFLATGFCLVICGIIPLTRMIQRRRSDGPDAAAGGGFFPGPATCVAGLLAAGVGYIESPLDGTVWDQPGKLLHYFLLEANDELKESLIALTFFLYAFDRLRAAQSTAITNQPISSNGIE